jgi:DNA modification methylase
MENDSIKIFNNDCLKEMKNIEDKSIDLIFCDLPYGQTSCKWDCKIDLKELWKQIMRIKRLNAPIFFTTTTKYGAELILSAPKKCHFRYDIVWCKSAPVGFLSAKKMPLRKHEMIYVFYEKLPFYDLSSHKHKFIDQSKNKNKLNDGIIYNGGKQMKVISDGKGKQYEPPLPVSVVKEEMRPTETYKNKSTMYGNIDRPDFKRKNNESMYEPPLPVSVVKEEPQEYTLNEDYDKREKKTRNTIKKQENYGKGYLEKKVNFRKYDPTLGGKGAPSHLYEPPLPNSMLEIKSTRGKHSTEKPVALIEWILKYYSKEGDTILDPTMGSGSCGVACKNMNRKFIGIEMDEDIYKVACDRLK